MIQGATVVGGITVTGGTYWSDHQPDQFYIITDDDYFIVTDSGDNIVTELEE